MHKPSNQVASLCFKAWTPKQPPRAAERRVSIYPACPTEGVPHSFSDHLIDLTWQSLEDYDEIVKVYRPWRDKTRASLCLWLGGLQNLQSVCIFIPLLGHEKVLLMYLAMNLKVDVSKMSAASAAIFATLQSIHARANEYVLAVRGSRPFQEAWGFFGSIPNPPPSPYWRYSTKTTPNQHIMDFLPSLIKDSDLETYHYSRDKNFELEEPGSPVPQTRIDGYICERQYEVFTVEPLLREAAAQDGLYESYYNHNYTFNLITPLELAHDLTSRSTYVIRLRAKGRERVGPAIFQSRSRLAPGLPPSIFKSSKIRAEKGTFISSQGSDAPPLPEVGIELTIDSQLDLFNGTVEAVEDDLLTMKVVRK